MTKFIKVPNQWQNQSVLTNKIIRALKINSYWQWVLFKALIICVLICLIWLIDSITKSLNFDPTNLNISTYENSLYGIKSVFNPGLTFFQWFNFQPELSIIHLFNFLLLIVCAGAISYQINHGWSLLIGLSLITGASLGNMIDRFIYEQGVRDWLYLPWINQGASVFNLADMFALSGSIVCLLTLIWQIVANWRTKKHSL